MSAVLPQLQAVLEAWQRGPHAHEPLVLTPRGDGEAIVAQVGAKGEMNVTELCHFCGITRGQFYKRWRHHITKRGKKYAAGDVMRLRDTIGRLNDEG